MKTNQDKNLMGGLAAVRAEVIRLTQAIQHEQDAAKRLELEVELKDLIQSTGLEIDPQGFAIPKIEPEAPKAQAAAEPEVELPKEEEVTKVSFLRRARGWIMSKYYYAKFAVLRNPKKAIAATVGVIGGLAVWFFIRGRATPTVVIHAFDNVAAPGFFTRVGNGLSNAASTVTGYAGNFFRYVGGKAGAAKDAVVGMFQRAPGATVDVMVVPAAAV